MSTIFGIYHLDTTPVSIKTLRNFSSMLQIRGSDGIEIWEEGPTGLGCSRFATTPEDLLEAVPYVDKRHGLVITANARLDNRLDLAQKLNITIGELSKTGDSMLILLAYARWGVDCFKELLGDFCFVIWDNRRNSLHCCRDALGIKPFYYFANSRKFLFCSDIQPLIKQFPIIPPVNEGIVAEYLAFQLSNREETLFTGIFRLPPGHFLSIVDGNIKVKKYWELSIRKPIIYRDKNAYSEHFLELFSKAVSRRTRSHCPVAVEVSGGLDSSAILATASMATKKCGRSSNLRPYSLVFPGLPCDELRYINSLFEKLGLSGINIPGHIYKCPNWRSQVLESYQIPDMPNLSMCDGLIADIAAAQCRVVLSGIGGDQFFTGLAMDFFDIIARGRFYDLICEFFKKNIKNQVTYSKQAIKLLLWRHGPGIARRAWCQKKITSSLPSWLPKSFISRTNLVDRIAANDSRLLRKCPIDAAYYKYFISDQLGFFLETLDRHRTLRGVENRYPFLDRQLVEFAINIPEYIKMCNGQTKYPIRDSLASEFPPLIQKRRDKAEFSFFMGQAFLQEESRKRLTKLSIANNGWVDQREFTSTYNKVLEHFINKPAAICHVNTWPVWTALATDIWFETLYH